MARPAPLLRTARIALVPYLVALLLLTWSPADEARPVTGFVDVIAHWLSGGHDAGFPAAYTVVEFVANVVLFVPFGVLASLRWPRMPWWAAAVAGLVLSVVIELVQSAIPSRVATLSDVVANSVGALLGCVAVALVARRTATGTAHG